jgi:hypothetical protein
MGGVTELAVSMYVKKKLVLSYVKGVPVVTFVTLLIMIGGYFQVALGAKPHCSRRLATLRPSCWTNTAAYTAFAKHGQKGYGQRGSTRHVTHFLHINI